MLKEAFAYLVSLGNTMDTTIELEGTTYLLDRNGGLKKSLAEHNAESLRDEEVAALNHAFHLEDMRRDRAYDALYRKPATIDTSTLTSISSYIKANPEGFLHTDVTKPIIHIASATEVRLLTAMDIRGARILVMRAKAITPEIELGRKIQVEQFILMLQTQFAQTEDRELVLKLVGNLSDQETFALKDDGIRQTVTVKRGAADIAEARVLNPVTLAPFRTFTEAEQPRSHYALRVWDKNAISLSAVGGNEWQITAMRNIQAYFDAELDGLGIDIIM